MATVAPITTTEKTAISNKRKNNIFLAGSAVSTLALSGGGYFIGKRIEDDKFSTEKKRVDEINKKELETYNAKIQELDSKILNLSQEISDANRKNSEELLKINDRLRYLHSLTFEESTMDIKDKLSRAFPDLVERINRNKLTEMPNCMMVYGKDKKNADILIDWFFKMSDCNIRVIDESDGILKALENGQIRYEKTKIWNLLYVKNFTNRIDHQIAKFPTIEAAKDWMCAAAEDFHTTILFYAEDPDKLDDIALESHRVHDWFDIDNKIIECYQGEVDKNDVMRALKTDIELKELRDKLDTPDANTEKKALLKSLREERAKLELQKIEMSMIKKYSKIGLAVGAGVSALIIATATFIKNKKNNVNKNKKDEQND